MHAQALGFIEGRNSYQRRVIFCGPLGSHREASGRSRSDAMGRAAKKDHPERGARAASAGDLGPTGADTLGGHARGRQAGRVATRGGGSAFRPMQGPLQGKQRRIPRRPPRSGQRGAAERYGRRRNEDHLAAGFIGSEHGPKPSGARSPAEPARAASRRRAAEPERAEQRPSGSPGAPTGGGGSRWKTLVYQGFGSELPSSGTRLDDRRRCTALASTYP